DQRRRLDLLDAGGDSRATVTSVFSWSLRHLPADAARTFRLLGLHPGPDFDAYAAAALTGTNLEQARCTVELLARTSCSGLCAASRRRSLLVSNAYGSVCSGLVAGPASSVERWRIHSRSRGVASGVSARSRSRAAGSRRLWAAAVSTIAVSTIG